RGLEAGQLTGASRVPGCFECGLVVRVLPELGELSVFDAPPVNGVPLVRLAIALGAPRRRRLGRRSRRVARPPRGTSPSRLPSPARACPRTLPWCACRRGARCPGRET